MIGTESLIKYYRFPEKALGFIFYKNGYCVASYPWAFIIASLLLFFGTAAGMLKMQMEKPEDVWELYFPAGNPATEGSVKLSHDFPSHSGDNYWSFQDTGEVVSLNAMFIPDVTRGKINLTSAIVNVRESCRIVKNFEARIKGERVKFHNVCAIRQEAIGQSCVWPKLCDDLEKSSNLICDEDAYKLESNFVWNKTFFNLSEACEPKEEIISTPAIRLNWFFRKDTIPERRVSEDFIRQVFDALFEKSRKDLSGTVYFFSTVVQFDEYHSIAQSDSPFVGVTVAMMTIFSVLVSLKIPGFTRSRSILALAGVVATCFAIGSTLGVLAIIGVPFIEVAFLTPFIMLGIGIDSTFVLMFTWAKQQQQLLEIVHDKKSESMGDIDFQEFRKLGSDTEEPQERIGLKNLQFKDLGVKICVAITLRKAMISIFISSITSFLAFLVGSFTPYKAVNITCYHLGLFTIFLLIYETTFFTASLALHHKRVISYFNPIMKKDIILNTNCDKSSINGETSPKPDSKKPKMMDSVSSKDQDCLTPVAKVKGVSLTDHFNKLELMVKEWLPKIVLNTIVRFFAVISVVFLLATSTYQVLHMQQYFNEIEYQPDNSRILDYYKTSRKLFEDPIIVSLVIDEKIDYWRNSELGKLQKMYHELAVEDFCDTSVNSRMQPWFVMLNETLEGIDGRRKFRRRVKDWQMMYSKTPLINNWVISDEYDLSKTRFFLALEPVPEKNLQRTKEIIAKIHEITSRSRVNLYFTSRDLMLWERNSHMRQSIWITILIALTSCVGVTVFLLPHPVVFTAVSLCGAFTMISTLGCMALYGIEYSLCTYIIVLLMIGLCIDYISHTGHAYIVNMTDSKKESTKKALENIGVPLFNAALSSIISISMLGFSYSNMMRRLFVSMVLLFGFSFFYGVIFLPIILSMFGPTKPSKSTKFSSPKKPRSGKNASPQCKYSVPAITQKVFAESFGSENGKKRESLVLLTENQTKETDQNDEQFNGASSHLETSTDNALNVSGDRENASSVETDSNI